MKWMHVLNSVSRPLLLTAGVAAIAIVGFVDYVTGPELSFSIFYLLPVSVLAWYVSLGAGAAASIASAAAWLAADLLAGHPYTHRAIPFWNALVRLGVFLVVAATLGSLRRSEDRRAELLSFIVHDLRSPLTNVMLGLDVLRSRMEDMLDSRHRDFLNGCMASCRRMLTLTNAILDLSRMESGRMPLDVRDANVADVVEHSLDQISLSAAQKDVKLRAELGPRELTVKADVEATIRILVNLLSNAIKYTPAGTTVTVEARALGADAVQITVVDQGEGVPKEWADKIFEKYIQIDSDRKAAVLGSGLGLAFARQAVEAQGGRIWLETERKPGMAVSFTLPSGSSRERRDYTSNQASS